MGATIATAHVSRVRGILFATLFSMTAPFGIALGIGITKSYNPDSPIALWVRGILESAAAGILIYAGLVDLVRTCIAHQHATYSDISIDC